VQGAGSYVKNQHAIGESNCQPNAGLLFRTEMMIASAEDEGRPRTFGELGRIGSVIIEGTRMSEPCESTNRPTRLFFRFFFSFFIFLWLVPYAMRSSTVISFSCLLNKGLTPFSDRLGTRNKLVFRLDGFRINPSPSADSLVPTPRHPESHARPLWPQ